MGMMQEFKQFAMKGNVVDLAVGVIIGGAFSKIVIPWYKTSSCPPLEKFLAVLISPTTTYH